MINEGVMLHWQHVMQPEWCDSQYFRKVSEACAGCRECTTWDFPKMPTLNFKGSEGVVGLHSVTNTVEIKKLEFEMLELKVKGNDVVTYSQRFQELALMYERMFPEEIDQVEKYVGSLPDTIHGNVMVTKQITKHDAIGRDCKESLNVNTGAIRGLVFECGAQGHFKKDCSKLKNNNNRGNQAGNARLRQRCMPWAMQGQT
ncbi:hypothetical protein Tco_1236448 [Tanacetum coccineum]